MLYSLKKVTGHERPKEKSTNKKKNKQTERWYPPLPSHPLPDINQPPPPFSSPIIHNDITIDTEFLVQMRQSNKFGSVSNDEIFNLQVRSGAGPWVIIPCLLQDTSHIYRFHPPKQLTRKKQRIQKSDLTLKKLYRTTLVYKHRTQH